jgi:hypothetical protein
MSGVKNVIDALEIYRVFCSANYPDIYPALKSWVMIHNIPMLWDI